MQPVYLEDMEQDVYRTAVVCLRMKLLRAITQTEPATVSLDSLEPTARKVC